jgi:hypothetical protein
VHSRRARPTLRLIEEDLAVGWESPQPLRLLADGARDGLHPLSELPHPIITKAAESFGPDAASDNYVGPVACSARLRLLEIKIAQWRGGVWKDPGTGVHWLVVAGLAKGGHRDHDDFYERVKRENDGGDPERWLPTAEDHRLLKRETAARLMTEWELGVQEQALKALREVRSGGSTRITVPHPVPGNGSLAQFTLAVTAIREDGYEADEIEAEIVPASSHAGSNLAWRLTTRILISLSPPEQGWDRYKNSYANIAEPGWWAKRVAELEALVAGRELAESEPGRHSHYVHRTHLAGNTIEGKAVRAICGVFFVPAQDHQALPTCPACKEQYDALPG